MELKEQVTTYEQSKKIQELGFSKISLCTWVHTWNQGWSPDDYHLDVGYKEHEGEQDRYNAYTASELMDILPETIYDDEDDDGDDEVHGKGFDLLVYKEDGKYNVQYANSDWEENYNTIHNTNLAQALGDMLLYLLENNLMPTE